jgi:hypothetical protein
MSGNQPSISIPQGDQFLSTKNSPTGVDSQGRKLERDPGSGSIMTETTPGSYTNLDLQKKQAAESELTDKQHKALLKGRPYVPFSEQIKIGSLSTRNAATSNRIQYFADQKQKGLINDSQLKNMISKGELSKSDLDGIYVTLNPKSPEAYDSVHGVGAYKNKQDDDAKNTRYAQDKAKRDSEDQTLLPGIPNASLIGPAVGVLSGAYGVGGKR